MYIVAKCDKQAIVTGLSLTTLGDDGHDRVLSTVDQRSSPVDHTQRDGQLGVRYSVTRGRPRQPVLVYFRRKTYFNVLSATCSISLLVPLMLRT